jgi:transcriptional regulator with XRE-family HTH domain
MTTTNPRGPNAIDQHVGARIRLRRSLMTMSQSELGEKLGVTFQQVQKYERGTNRVGASRLWLLANVMEVPVSYFYDGLEQDGSTSVPAADNDTLYDFIASPDGIDLARAFSAIKDAKVRRRMIDLCRALGPAALSDAEAAKLYRRQAKAEGVKAA